MITTDLFSIASAYLEIYYVSNRWDKEETLYHSFGEDRSSFGFLTYDEAKQRKNSLSRLFSQKAIAGAQALILEKVYLSITNLTGLETLYVLISD